MSSRSREYREVISSILDDVEKFKAQGLSASDLLEPDEWQALRDIVGNVVKKIEPPHE